ncbi:hypothetical protein [Flavobacterium sp.]|uniref:hypothetical protein n=1 Tax=Flavobacterium sp. TaxID=239 RepID=UPI001219B228|nr:hypothetical protein [Flavobacterium sp.]RZJ73518.1 MAG: hypothetical protein EOO49_01515 [Flavobacterium sp.]
MKTNFKFCLAALLFAGMSAQAQTIDEYANCTGGGTDNGIQFGDSYFNTFFGVEAGRNIVNKEKGRNNSFFGHQAGRATVGGSTVVAGVYSGSDNSFFGNLSGTKTTTGYYNVFVGSNAGGSNTTGYTNTFLGNQSGALNTTGIENLFFGHAAGYNNTSGGWNICLGNASGYNLSSGGGNIFIGHAAGNATTTALGNTYIGFGAGQNATGEYSVFLGSEAGKNETTSRKLYIDNSSTANPLIWGDFTADQLKFHGKVGIGGNSSTAFGAFPTTAGGVSVSNYNLFVKGGILTEEVRVNLTSGGTWADYVFEEDYDLKPLSEVKRFIDENGHLPNVPSAAEVKRDGIELGNMAKIQQEKIEELTLYLIQQQKEIDELKAQVKALIEKR